MLRGVHAALAVAAVCGGLSAGAAGAGISAGAWPRPPELAAALGNRRGAIVAVRPSDGEILGVAGALASLREAAPPGSVAKVVTAYAALEGGLTDAGRRIVCRGTFAGRSCAKPHGPLTLEQALARSCNVHFLTLGAEVGANRLRAAARQFGFGGPTGADAAESAGTVEGAALDLAYGVGGFAATPLQVARAMAAVANGGQMLGLHLGPGRPQVVETLATGYLAPIRAGLRAGTLANGTAEALSGLSVAGKTGTAIFDPGVAGETPRWYGHFAGYAPADRPEVVVAVRVEGRSAAHDAVPVARAVLRAWPRATTGRRGGLGTGPGATAHRDAISERSRRHRAAAYWYVREARCRGRKPESAAGELLRAGSTGEDRAVASRTVRVLLWAASDIRAFEVVAPGGRIEAGGERSGLGDRRVLLKVAGTAVAAEGGGRRILADRLAIRPAPGATLALRPLAAAPARRGRPESLASRRIPGPIAVRADRGRLIAVAAVPLDAYAGAVAVAELGPGWPAAAVAAQAILARTYAARHPDRHWADGADLCDVTHCQVYKGDTPAGTATRRTLSATAGTVLTSSGEPIEALYHAICGGRRLANEEVFGGKPLPYLRGGPDPWCTRSPRYAAWRARFTRAQLTRAFATDPGLHLGTVSSLTITARSASGAPAAVTLDGTAGARTIPAYQVWRDLGMSFGWTRVKSVRFSTVPDGDGVVFLGRGLGHAVGLCQWGARAQAEHGASTARILASYYPGTRLEVLPGRSRPPAPMKVTSL